MFESVWPGRKFNVLYSIDAANLSASDLKQDGALVLDYRGERVTDLTDIAMKEPALLLPLETSPLRLELSRHEVLAGLDSYAARISSLPDRSVRFLYAVNDVRAGTFDAQLDARGEVRFSVGAETAKGSYTFLAVLPEGRERWALVDAQLFVR